LITGKGHPLYSMKATHALHDLGQSLWLDNITRDLLNSGTLKRFIEAWKRARIIVDTGGGHSGTPPRAAESARDTGQIKSIPAKAMRPAETEAAFLIARIFKRVANGSPSPWGEDPIGTVQRHVILTP
jgi:hypothetical protein